MTKCYTFYSYKGGSGRTTTALNTIKHLYGQFNGPLQRILLVDADLESAGLTYFFGLEKRISSKFSETLHTTKVLSGLGDPNIMFHSENHKKRTIYKSDLARIAKAYGDIAVDYFCDIPLLDSEILCLSLILDKLASTNDDTRREIYENFNPEKWLLGRLRAIQNDAELSTEEKICQKRDALVSFLPPVTFVDVSAFFGLPKGSVDFLGVSVNSRDSQTARNDACRNINTLLNQCAQTYAAVVFDCGAGTQSTAHALHNVSDVLVYCMRPTLQFVKGTRTNLDRYHDILAAAQEVHEKEEGQKTVILLPTAVAKPADKDPLTPIYDNCFASLREILSDQKLKLVDDTFCNPQKALCEVQLFKWREMVLGTTPQEEDPSIAKALAAFADPATMPKDAAQAYQTYRLLAQRLVANS